MTCTAVCTIQWLYGLIFGDNTQYNIVLPPLMPADLSVALMLDYHSDGCIRPDITTSPLPYVSFA